MKFNRDWMGMADVTEVATATMGVINGVQDHPTRSQVAAISAAFVLIVEQVGISPADAMTITKNIINHADGRRPEFKAIEDYINHEL